MDQTLLKALIVQHDLPIKLAPVFRTAPGPVAPSVTWDRVEGMLLGLAIGDALGNPTEGLLPAERARLYGEVRDYPDTDRHGHPSGGPSDDTQLAFWTLEQLLADRGFVPEHVARRFCQDRIYGIGRSVKEFIATTKAGREPWYRCGARSAGNGALIRIAPILVPHLRLGTSGLWADAALAAAITHRDAASITACIAFVAILWQALQLQETPGPCWWLDRSVETAREIEGQTQYRPRGGDFRDFEGPLWQYASQRVGDAYFRDQTVPQACNSWFSGAYLLETVPSVLYILMRYGHDPERAIIRAVNDTKDNDTIAAIVGAAVGLLHGKRGLPRRWITGLSGRTRADDDGGVFALIAAARRTRWR